MKTILKSCGAVMCIIMLIASSVVANAGNEYPGKVNAPGGATKGKGRWVSDSFHGSYVTVYCDTAYPTEQCWCIDGGTLYTGHLTAGHNPAGGELIEPTVNVYN